MSDEAQQPLNSFAAQQRLLRERLHHLLATLHPALQADVTRALEERGKLLYQSPYDASVADTKRPSGSWPLLTLLIAQHFSPQIDPALAYSVALATECFVCALDLLDDVEDEDQSAIILEIGTPRALNISTVLLTLAQQIILSLAQQGVDAQMIIRLLNTLQEATLVAAAGQHRDLLAEQRQAHDLTREECIEIAAAKAGAIMRLACLLGAMCANADDVECAEFARMGELLGIAHQLDNDSHDLYDLLQVIDTSPGKPPAKGAKTDLVRGKKTLPIVLAAGKNMPLQESRKPTDSTQQDYLGALREGIVTTWGISLLYRERAADHLRAISSRRTLAPELRLLLGFS